MECRESELHLGLDRAEPDDLQVVGLLRGVVEQRGLPDAGVAAQHEDTAQTDPNGADDPIDLSSLDLTIQQRHELGP